MGEKKTKKKAVVKKKVVGSAGLEKKAVEEKQPLDSFVAGAVKKEILKQATEEKTKSLVATPKTEALSPPSQHPQQQEWVETHVQGIRNVYANGSGGLNADVQLGNGGFTLLRDLVSCTVGQKVRVHPSQIIGGLSQRDVQAAYEKGRASVVQANAEQDE